MRNNKQKEIKKHFEIFYSNINGYSTKEDSLRRIIEREAPDIITLCETKRGPEKRIKKDEIKGYEVLERNLKAGKEGLMIAAKIGSFKTIKEITESEMKNIMTVQIEYPHMTIRIILVHAPQETAVLEDRSDFFNEVAEQIERCQNSGDKMVLLGDFNAKTLSRPDDSNSNNTDNSRINNNDVNSTTNNIKFDNKSSNNSGDTNNNNGGLLSEKIKDYELKVANFSPNTTGKWTRIQPQNDGSIAKSALDYVVLEDDMYDAMKSMVIDEDKIHCPYWANKKKKGTNVQFSDHCTIIVKFELDVGLLRRERKGEKYKAWKLTDEGIVKYRELSEVDVKVDMNVDMSPSTAYAKWVGKFEDILRQCFDKKTVCTQAPSQPKNHKSVRRVLSETAKEGKIQRQVVKVYMKRLIGKELKIQAKKRAKRLTDTTEQLTVKERMSPQGFWKVKKAADKNIKKVRESPNVVKENGVEIAGDKAITEAYREEFQHRLRNREPKKGWEDHVKETNNDLHAWLNEKGSKSSTPFELDSLAKIVKKVKKGKSPGIDRYPPEFFLYMGKGLLRSLLELFNFIKDKREIPDQWNSMMIVTIYKNKGSKKMLKNYRGIFLTVIVSKVFEGMIKERIQDQLVKVNILQAGSRFNRGAGDNVFLLRAAIDHYVNMKKPLFVTAYDYEQAFDSLWMEDCILALKDLGVSQEMLQLIFSLNKNAKVVVQTPHGLTTEFTTDPIVKQGTVLGSILCSSSTGEYCGVNVGVAVGTMILASLLYVDDIIDLSLNTDECLKAHENALTFSNKKKLSLSGSKCFNMVINQNEENLPVDMEIDEEKKVVVAEEIVYLGDVFDVKGSNNGLIHDRVRRGTKASISIQSLLAETDVGKHKISVSLLLYGVLFLSTVLFNSQTWSNLKKKDIEALPTLQLKFLKKIVDVARSTCNAFTFLELGVLPIEHEIRKRQLMYLHRILQLEHDDPVVQMFHNIVDLHKCGESNWWTDVKHSMEKYNIDTPLDEIAAMSKERFRVIVNTSVKKLALRELVDEVKTKKKTKHLIYTELQTQSYLLNFYPTQARTIFKSRCQTLDIKSHLTYRYDDLCCRVCGEGEESLIHVVNCGSDDILQWDPRDLDDTNTVNTRRCIKRIEMFIETVTNSNS